MTVATAVALPQDETTRPAGPEPTPVQEGERPPVALEEIVVTATRGPHDVFDLPRSVIVVDREELQRQNQAVGLDALEERIGIWVEHRNGVSADPVLRGFSGANILALVDGNSLTTLWGEGGYAGDDMYGKVDAESLEAIEVVRGPSSVLYGSNALGGVINFITRRPPEYTGGGFEFGGSLKSGFWGATNGVLLRADQYGADDRFRYRLGYSMRDIGDTRGGGDLGLLEPSGVDESNFDWNSEVRLGAHDTLGFDLQSVNRNGLPKYFRPTQRNDNDRLGASLRWRSTNTVLGDEVSWTVYHQNKEDERFWLDQDKRGIATWRTFSTDFQSMTGLGDAHLLTWGLHYGNDEGESPDDEQFTITTPATGAQKASPDSTWENLGLYAQDEWSLGGGWSVIGSARVDAFDYEADDNPFWTIPGSSAAENIQRSEPGTFDETAVTGGLGLARTLDPGWMVYGSWSRGYRLFPPGFGLRQTGYGVLAPTDGFLDPTTADQFELGTRWRRSWWSATVATYYSFLRDVQQPVPGSYDGLTEIDIDGSGTIDPDESIYVVSGADGYVTGVEVDTAIDLGHFWGRLDGWSWHNGFMWNEGRVDVEDGDEPLRHTHPARFLSALRWEDRDAPSEPWFELVADVVDRFDAVSDARLQGDVGYLDDPQDPSSGLRRSYGLPGYTVFHARGGLKLNENARLTVGVENLFDKLYRTAHSRMDAAGRSILLGLTVSF